MRYRDRCEPETSGLRGQRGVGGAAPSVFSGYVSVDVGHYSRHGHGRPTAVCGDSAGSAEYSFVICLRPCCRRRIATLVRAGGDKKMEMRNLDQCQAAREKALTARRHAELRPMVQNEDRRRE